MRKDLVFLLDAESFFTFVKKDSKCTDPQKLDFFLSNFWGAVQNLEPIFVRIEKIFLNFTCFLLLS